MSMHPLEENQDAHQMEIDRAKFAILEVSSKNERTFEIVLPKDIISVSKVSVVSAAIEFGDRSSIELEIPQTIPEEQSEPNGELNKAGHRSKESKYGKNENDNCKYILRGRRFTVEIPRKHETNAALMLWKRQMYNRREKFFVAELDVTFIYWLLTATKERIIKKLHSVAEIVVGLDDKKNEQYKVIDTRVFFE